MFSIKRTLRPLLVAAAVLAQPVLAAGPQVSSAALEAGTGSKVRLVRLSVQSDWERRWFDSNGTHLSGYWDANIGHWRGDRYQNLPGQHQDITVVGLTPVFRFQRTDKLGWYGEAAVGISLLSERYDNNDDKLSTRFQFADHIGAGYVFNNKWDIGLRYQHYSNGGYKKPNSGVDFLVLRAAYRF